MDLHSLRTQQEESLDQATPTAASAASEAAQPAVASTAPTAVDNKSASAAAVASSAAVGGAKPLNATESGGAGRTCGIDVMLSQNRPSKPSHVPIRSCLRAQLCSLVPSPNFGNPSSESNFPCDNSISLHLRGSRSAQQLDVKEGGIHSALLVI